MVDVVYTDHDVLPLGHRVPPGQLIRHQSPPEKHWRVGVQPHALIEAAHVVLQSLVLLHGGEVAAT
jgi:hypothetical protein